MEKGIPSNGPSDIWFSGVRGSDVIARPLPSAGWQTGHLTC